jgi:hypothetical protein
VAVKSELEVFVRFDFRGKSLSPQVTVDLDLQMEQQGHLSDFKLMLARENGIDLYSYEFEVMESLPIVVRRATGLAEQFSLQGVFDAEGFEARWRVLKEQQQIEAVALEYLDRETLEQNPQWQAALLAVYQLGKRGL